MNKERFLTLSLIVLLAAASRLVPHPYNFAPITAIALFSGANFERKPMAFIVPLLAMLLSDAVIGFYPQMWVVYMSFALIVCMGFLLRGSQTFVRVFLATFSASVMFFLITNCPLWNHYDLYPKTFAGMVESYTMALPFFKHTLFGDMFYSALMFGGFALTERRFPRLQARFAAA